MKNSTLLKIVISTAVGVAALVFFVKTILGGSSTYRMVDDLINSGVASYENREMQVHGWVLAGSIKEDVVGQKTIRTFVLQKDGKRIRVFHTGSAPDTFKDQSEVVATGKIISSAAAKSLADGLKVTLEADLTHVVDASALQAKCPSKYEGAAVNKNLDPNFN